MNKHLSFITYHSESHIGLLQSGAIIGTITRYSYNLSIRSYPTINDALHQCVLVLRRWASQYS